MGLKGLLSGKARREREIKRTGMKLKKEADRARQEERLLNLKRSEERILKQRRQLKSLKKRQRDRKVNEFRKAVSSVGNVSKKISRTPVRTVKATADFGDTFLGTTQSKKKRKNPLDDFFR